MKRLILCLSVVLPFVLAGEALAKKVVSAKVCGASDCRTVKDRDGLAALHEGGAPTDPPAAAAAFYRAELTVLGDGERFTFPIAIVPEAGLVRGGTEAEGYGWMPVSDRALREYRRITRGLEPLPAAKLAGLDAPGPGEARVDEVVLPPADDPEPASGASVWPWIAAGLAAIGLLTIAAGRLRRRNRGLPEPGPAQG
jgi:hypothetical protein